MKLTCPAPQKSIENLSLPDKTAVNNIWSQFAAAHPSLRQLILKGLLSICCPSQLSFLNDELRTECRIDPLSLLPREISLRIMRFLDASSLCRAAQVSKHWRTLADDDMLWRKMCEQHIEKKCDKCGWGLPLMERTRRTRLRSRETSPTPSASPTRPGAPTSQLSSTPTSQSPFTPYQAVPASTADGMLPPLPPDAQAPGAPAPVRVRTDSAASQLASANAAFQSASGRPSQAIEFEPLRRTDTPPGESVTDPSLAIVTRPPKRDRRGRVLSPSGSPQQSPAELTPAEGEALCLPSLKKRPWKSVYSERLIIERNWRKGSCAVQVFSGHTDAVTCLQVEENLHHPSFPVLMTGSWDRTVRIWNLETGEEVGCLRGHERGIRALQFDSNKLITVCLI